MDAFYSLLHKFFGALLKFVYAASHFGHPAIIKIVEQLQRWLTSVEIENNTIYVPEFLYYWGMTCLGEQSDLIIRELGIAETCFSKIESSMPQAKARLAYIGLLKSTEPAKNESNVSHLETLRLCANHHRDMLSMIALAKIQFQFFLKEQQERNADAPIAELPMRVMRLLEWPCNQGHPVAIRFWNDMVGCLQCQPGVILPYYPERSICTQTLYDLETSANMQTGP